MGTYLIYTVYDTTHSHQLEVWAVCFGIYVTLPMDVNV